MSQNEFQDKSPSTLVATIVAAKRAGYRDLERTARRELEERFGIKISFSRLVDARSSQNGRGAK